ncbi:MAG TPA: triose-phosphate isomerase, partial [Conexibacter sp.]
LLEVVEAASAASARDDVAVIVTPPALDVEAVKRAGPNLWIFAQAMDLARPGASTGAILPEALAAVGADGVMLNHAERPLEHAQLPQAVEQARTAGLQTLLCAEDVAQATRFAAWGPDVILLEPHELIGTAHHSHRPWIGPANAAVAEVDPRVLVMHAGGVADERDVRAILAQGATGTGCTSAIVRAADRRVTIERMIRAVREGWDARDELVASTTTNDGSETQ